MVVQVGINHTQSGPTLRHILPDKKSFDDDDDEEEEEEKEEEEDDVMKEMRLCTPWISTPFDPPPAKTIDFITQHSTPFLRQNQLLAPTPPPISAKAEGTPAGTTQLS